MIKRLKTAWVVLTAKEYVVIANSYGKGFYTHHATKRFIQQEDSDGED